MLAALIAAATRPLWWQPPPYFVLDDGFGHLFRVLEFDRVIAQGVFYPRWAPDLAYGYGYPVFNYYAPLIYYIAEAFHLLSFSITASIKLLMGATVAIAAAGAYIMGRELARPESARSTAPTGLLQSRLTPLTDLDGATVTPGLWPGFSNVPSTRPPSLKKSTEKPTPHPNPPLLPHLLAGTRLRSDRGLTVA
jgi:hypothetical protein